MRPLGWCWVVVCVLVGACQAPRHDDEPVPSAPANEAGGGRGGAAPGIGGLVITPAAVGGQPAPEPPDLSGVVAPSVSCHTPWSGGAAGDASVGGDGAAESSLGGAPNDDSCAPPPSRCADERTLVYFDEGECVAGQCIWQKRSLQCQTCAGNGCQDSITTK